MTGKKPKWTTSRGVSNTRDGHIFRNIFISTAIGSYKIVPSFTDADDFEPEVPMKPVKPTDKWEGEDEDEDLKVYFISKPEVKYYPNLSNELQYDVIRSESSSFWTQIENVRGHPPVSNYLWMGIFLSQDQEHFLSMKID